MGSPEVPHRRAELRRSCDRRLGSATAHDVHRGADARWRSQHGLL